MGILSENIVDEANKAAEHWVEILEKIDSVCNEMKEKWETFKNDPRSTYNRSYEYNRVYKEKRSKRRARMDRPISRSYNVMVKYKDSNSKNNTKNSYQEFRILCIPVVVYRDGQFGEIHKAICNRVEGLKTWEKLSGEKDIYIIDVFLGGSNKKSK